MSKEETKQKRRRSGSRRSKQESAPDRSNEFVSGLRSMNLVNVLSSDQVDLIHDQSMRILEEIGIEFMLPEALEILDANGAQVDHSTGMVRMSRDLVEHWVSQAPSECEIRSFNPDRNLKFGGDHISYGSIASAPNSLDLDRNRRPGDHESFRELLKISHSLPTCSFMSGYPVEPIDLPANTRHLDCYHDMLTLSDKPFRIYAIGKQRVTDAFEMVRISHQLDREQLAEAPRLMTNLNINSPLRVDAPLLEGSIEMARQNQIVVVSPVAFAGAMSPITMSGTLIQFNAECLAGIAFLQMVRSGAPVMYGSVVANVDMKSGAPAFGTPETISLMLATGQMARRYNLPVRGFLGSSSKAADAQAAYETMICLTANILGGVHCVFHAHGMLDTGLIASYEKAMLDSDMIGMMQATTRTLDFSDAEEAFEAIKAVGPGGHFLGSPHTMSRYKTAFHQPMLSDWRPYEFWEQDGSKDTSERANVQWKDVLEKYTQPEVDPAIDAALQSYKEKRIAEIGSDDIS